MDTRIPVLIAGSGPAGLSAALALGRHGIPCMLVDDRRPPGAAQAHLTRVAPSTTDLFQAWGVGAEIGRLALDPRSAVTVAWRRTLLGEPYGVSDIGSAPGGSKTASGGAPRAGGWVSGASVEHVLVRAVRESDHVDHRVAAIGGLDVADDGVTATLRTSDGGTLVVHADHLLICDGVRAARRWTFDDPSEGVRTAADTVAIRFETDLPPTGAWRRHATHWIVNSTSSGCLIPSEGGMRWLFLAFQRVSPEMITHEWCMRVLRDAVGDAAPPLRILGAEPRRVQLAVSARFRHQRLFLLGESAHQLLPIGGVRLNAAVHDAHSLAEKLAAVHRGEAGPELLDAYEDERKPAAEANLLRCLNYLEVLGDTGIGPDVYAFAGALEETGDDAAVLRAMVRAAIANHRTAFGALAGDTDMVRGDVAATPTYFRMPEPLTRRSAT